MFYIRNLMLCAKIGGKIAGAHEIRDRNHASLYHGAEWTVEEDVLDFLTDAGKEQDC